MNLTHLNQLMQNAAVSNENQQYRRAIDWYTDLLSVTDPHLDDPEVKEMRLTALRERARLLHMVGEREAALACYEQYYLEAGTSHHAVEALVLIGTQCAHMGRHQQALAAQKEALQLAEALNYTAGRASAFGGMGVTLYYMERMEEALSMMQKALAINIQLENQFAQARNWNNIGIAHIHNGEIDKAIQAFEESLQLVGQMGEQDSNLVMLAVNIHSNLGECFQYLFDMEQALVYHQEGLALVAQKNLSSSISTDLMRNMGVDLVHLGRAQEGIDYLRRALAACDETNQPDVQHQTLYSLSKAELEHGNLEEARRHAEQLRTLAEARGARGYQAQALHALGLYQQKIGKTAVAEQLWQQALFLAHETGQRVLLWRLHAALADIATPALRGVHSSIAADVIQQIAFPIVDETLRAKFLNAPPVRRILEMANM
jgi:tetratricopeptide (TPR) repeat protein